MRCVINSKKLGRTLTFSIPGKSYIYVDINGQPGTLGNQICRGGRLRGDTISYFGSSEDEFKAICRKWYKKYAECWVE